MDVYLIYGALKVVLLHGEAKSVRVTKRQFQGHFNTWYAPAKNTILCLYCEFEVEGSIKEE